MLAVDEMIRLKGIAWDHPRGYEPLIAASASFTETARQVNISWDVRSLKEFGDMPIEALIDRYDLICIDHPYMGQADKNGLLLKLEDYISENELATLESQSTGPSFKSYKYNKHLYALPIDAAALVAAYRNDLLKETGISLPRSRSELFNFYGTVPKGFSVAWALCPTDFWCTFLSLAAQDSGAGFISQGEINIETGRRALEEIKRHLEHLHPDSMDWNPIQILDRMGDEEDLVYAPYLFGYTNYSRRGYKKNLIHFCNSPVGTMPGISTILGGVGLAVSSRCENPALAADFVKYVAGAEIQEGIFTINGGQPANIRAWKNPGNNVLCNNFFEATLETLEKAYVRPRHPGWNQFQEDGAELLHGGILKNRESHKLMDELNELYQTISGDEAV